eukprot:2587312-Heterocapsa_arctica.AAC.1
MEGGSQPKGLPTQPDRNEIVEQIIEVEEPVKGVVTVKKPRAKPKPKEVSITKEDIMEAVKEATKKTVPDKIDKNKEM